MEKKLDGNYTKMLRAILNKWWRQHPTKQQLYGYLPHITKTIQVRRTRHAGHCWRCEDGLISDVLQWTPSHGRAKAGRPARIYIQQQLCADTGCSLEDLLGAMDDRDGWRKTVGEIHAGGSTWWYIYIYICVCVCVCVWIYIYIYIYIYSFKSNSWHRVSWISLTVCIYLLSFLVGPLVWILRPYRADVYKSFPVGQQWRVQM